MYLRKVKRKNRNGIAVEYLQLAKNNRDPLTQTTRARIVHSFGRADKVAMASLERLCRSIARICNFEIIKNSGSHTEEQLDSGIGKDNPMGKPSRETLEKRIRTLEKVASEREEALTKAQEIAQLGNWVLDVSTNSFFWSDEAYRIYGMSLDATPEDFWATAHPGDLEIHKKAVEDAFYKNKPYNIDHRLIRPDGVERIVNEQAEIVCDDDGNLVRIVGTVQDITERKKVEAMLERHRDDLEAVVKERTENLVEANTALRVLVKDRHLDKIELEKKVLFNIRELVEPFVEKLERSGLNNKQNAFLDILKSNLNDIVSSFSSRLSERYMRLTPMEIKVANLVRQEKTTKEIATLLQVSITTIDFHRKNIRHKLGLTNERVNLKTFLQTIQSANSTSTSASPVVDMLSEIVKLSAS